MLRGYEAPALEDRNLINEAFHSRALNDLRSALGAVLSSRKRVAILVDNLDKGWDKNADFRLMARFILGLLVARGSVIRDFSRQDWWRDKVRLTVSIFLRSDIYHYVRTEAREPDKLPLSTVRWNDKSTLLSVLEYRFEYKSAGGQPTQRLWDGVFCPHVDGVPVRDYIFNSVLPRPRDVLVLANGAISTAIDRGHERVEPEDFIAARDQYSVYAYDALLVENGVTIPEMKQALLAFLESEPILSLSGVRALLLRDGIPEDRVAPITDKLVTMSFLGVEVRKSEFEYPEVGSEADRTLALATRLNGSNDRRLRVHPAFRPFLEISSDPEDD